MRTWLFPASLLSGALTFTSTGCGLECGPDTIAVDGSCRPTAQVCGDGARFDEVTRQCLGEGAGLSCGAGTRLESGQCVPIAAGLSCGDGTVASPDGTTCIVASGACGEGTQLDVASRTCIGAGNVTCGPGTAEVDGACRPTSDVCGPGTIFSPDAARCIRGQAFVGDCASPTAIEGGRIDDERLLLAGGCFEVTGRVEVTGALRIEPGVTLVFQENTGLAVLGGILSAEGTDSAPIRFIGAQPRPGFWSGIELNASDRQENLLRHVFIEHAGGGGAEAALDLNARSDTRRDRLSMDRVVIRYSASRGLDLNRATLDVFDRISIDSNAGAPIRTLPDTVGQLAAMQNSFGGNEPNFIEVRGGAITTDQSWRPLAVPYLITSSVEVRAVLTLTPRTQILVDDGQQISVIGAGSVRAQEATLHSVSSSGRWSGLVFQGSQGNELVDSTVSDGGGVEVDGLRGSVVLTRGASLQMTGTALTDSAGYGLAASQDAQLVISQSRLQGNALGAAFVPWVVAGVLDRRTMYSGNEVDRVVVYDGRWNQPNLRLAALDVPYRVLVGSEIREPMPIDPGTVLKFAEGASFSIFGNGTIEARGTAANPIVFEGEMAVPGYWDGLFFNESDTLQNRLEHVRISHGGRLYVGAGLARANLVLFSRVVPTRISLIDVRLEDSAAAGVYSQGTVVLDACQRVSFSGVSPNVLVQGQPAGELCPR